MQQMIPPSTPYPLSTVHDQSDRMVRTRNMNMIGRAEKAMIRVLMTTCRDERSDCMRNKGRWRNRNRFKPTWRTFITLSGTSIPTTPCSLSEGRFLGIRRTFGKWLFESGIRPPMFVRLQALCKRRRRRKRLDRMRWNREVVLKFSRPEDLISKSVISDRDRQY